MFAVSLLPDPARATNPVATFSIVGADLATGEVGVAVQSKFFAVGAVVPWAKAGVGAIATQSFANTTYGPRGLAMLEGSASPEDVVKELTGEDEGRAQRQLGVVSADGRAAGFTGEECQPWAGNVSGRNYTAQGNILVSEATVQAMGQAFEETDGMLAEKLMRALEAGQAAGGDSRGQQSAAILVVKAGAGYGGFNDRYCDLRVDDHVTPIAELRRVFNLWKFNALIQQGYIAVEAGDFDAAYAAGEGAVEAAPDDGESHYHYACYLSRGGRSAEAMDRLEKAVQLDASLAARSTTDTDLTPLQADPRFALMVQRAAGKMPAGVK
jgi:uncharacterized Ntn-hydrolase superfamily protein